VSKLDGKAGLSQREKQIADRLKKALKSSEVMLEREMTGIEKELE